ncbi:response regulator transcription factor [Paenibacillus tuaregi]|uniref:response regulator transcription factor n=1 Tax=Paenibacillus tuaregi TaxID=1816681 RepID=UPI0008395CE4|nr:response regulator [Paenibacillus tuaregi]
MRTILVVDDEPRTRLGIKKTLDIWANGSCRVECVENGVEALEWLSRETAHLLITDVCMPEVSGLDLISALREHPFQPVAVVISGHAEFEYVQAALRLGAVNYLLKPIEKQELLEVVRQALKLEEERSRVGMMERLVDPKLLELDEQHGRFGEPVKEAVEYIEKHLEEPLTLAHLAARLHLNASYFSVLFKEQTGIPYTEYITRRRIQRAKELLAQTRLPVGEIAERVGYRTDKYFIKVFKQQERVSPSRYRQEISEESERLG